MKHHGKKRGFVASAFALVTATALALGGAAAAQAEPFPMPEDADVTITKLARPAVSGDVATGAKQTTLPAGATPIGGVTFSAYKVPTTAVEGSNAWQQEIASMTPASALDALGDPLPVAADVVFGQSDSTTGETTATDVPRGLYYVIEDASSADTNVAAAAPFLLTVPMTDPRDLNKWLDHIYVYPKNSKVDAEKTVQEGGILETGKDFTWTVTSDVPRIADGSGDLVAAQSFMLTDVLDERLSHVSTTARIIDGAGSAVTSNQLDDSDYTVDFTAPTLTVTFETAGLTKLLAAASTSGHRVEFTITTQVTTGVMPQGVTTTEIANIATITTNEGEDSEIIAETSEASTYWSVASFTKKNADGALAGAKFQIFASQADAEALTNALLTEQTSASSTGEVTFDGLRVSTHEDGVQINDVTEYQVYWIRETEAPANHQLLAETIPVLLTSDGKMYTFEADGNGKPEPAVGNTIGVKGATELTDIINVKNTGGFALPLTGGMGTAILTIGGIAILAIVLFVARRRRSEEAAQ